MTLCECGCGREGKEGKRFVRGHQIRVYNPTKGSKFPEEMLLKRRETFGVNKEIREGTRELPLCGCGCGGRVSNIRNRFIFGHSSRGRNNPMYGVEPWSKGLHHSEDSKRKMSEAHQGEGNPMYGVEPWIKGKHHSDKTKQKISDDKKVFYQSEEGKKWLAERSRSDEYRGKLSEAQQGEKNSFYNRHHSEESRIKMKIAHLTEDAVKEKRERRKHIKIQNHHTKPELKFEEICKKYNLHFQYVGDGQLWIGKDRVLNPDFIQADGQKVVVDIMGRYWHSPLFGNKNLRETMLQSVREKIYRRHKWHPIFIWDTDIMRPDGEEFVLSVLRKEEVIK